MAQNDHLPNLTSLVAEVAYANMDAFIDMLETRWVRGIEAQLSGCSTPGIIQSAIIYVPNPPSPWSVSWLSQKVREIQDRLKLKDATIDLSPRYRHPLNQSSTSGSCSPEGATVDE